MKFIYGQEEYLVSLNVKRLTKSKEVSFYGQNDDLTTILTDILTIGMFDINKTIVIKNHNIFKNDQLAQKILNEINMNQGKVELIFVLTDKLQKSNLLVKFLLKNAICQEFSTISSFDIIKTIKDVVLSNDGSISNSAAMMLSIRLPQNLRLIVNEVKKLLIENKKITEDMVEISIGKYLQDDVFALTNAITSHDPSGIIYSYRNKIENGDKPILIIAQIASILNLANMVYKYRRQGWSNQEIASTLKIHIYRIKKALELINNTSQNFVEEMIVKLAEVDKNIKIGYLEENIAMELFLLNLIK